MFEAAEAAELEVPPAADIGVCCGLDCGGGLGLAVVHDRHAIGSRRISFITSQTGHSHDPLPPPPPAAASKPFGAAALPLPLSLPPPLPLPPVLATG